MTKPNVVSDTCNIFAGNDHLAEKAFNCFDKKKTELSKIEIEKVVGLSDWHGTTMRICLLAIDQKKSWRLYDCKSMKEFMELCFPKNYDALNRNLVAARTAYTLGGLKMIGQFSDNAMQPLNKLSKKECKAVMKIVKQDFVGEYDRAKVTKTLVLEAMYKLEIKQRPLNKMKEPKDPYEDLTTEYKRNPKSFIADIAGTLLNKMKRHDVTQLIETLQSGIKKQ